MEKQTEWGQTVVHDDVLAAIAARAALSVSGVVQTSPRGLGNNLNSLVHHDALSRGIRVVQLGDGHYTVEIRLIMAFGTRLASVGRGVGQAVNEALREAVGLYPDKVTIHVDGIRTGE